MPELNSLPCLLLLYFEKLVEEKNFPDTLELKLDLSINITDVYFLKAKIRCIQYKKGIKKEDRFIESSVENLNEIIFDLIIPKKITKKSITKFQIESYKKIRESLDNLLKEFKI